MKHSAHRAFRRTKVTGCTAETGYHGAISRQVLGKVHLCLGSHELRRVDSLLVCILPCHKLCGTPPAGKDGLLLGREREGRGVTEIISEEMASTLAGAAHSTYM